MKVNFHYQTQNQNQNQNQNIFELFIDNNINIIRPTLKILISISLIYKLIY